MTTASPASSLVELADALALRIQQVREAGLLAGDDVLLNLDYSRQAEAAPFVFDMVTGTLHRNHCPAIPRSSKSALYAVDEMRAEDLPLACDECRPEPKAAPEPDPEEVIDMVYGALSFLHQFGSVLRERGREFRNSRKGADFMGVLQNTLGQFETKQNHASDQTGGMEAPQQEGFVKIAL